MTVVAVAAVAVAAGAALALLLALLRCAAAACAARAGAAQRARRCRGAACGGGSGLENPVRLAGVNAELLSAERRIPDRYGPAPTLSAPRLAAARDRLSALVTSTARRCAGYKLRTAAHHRSALRLATAAPSGVPSAQLVRLSLTLLQPFFSWAAAADFSGSAPRGGAATDDGAGLATLRTLLARHAATAAQTALQVLCETAGYSSRGGGRAWELLLMWCAAGDDGACRAVPELHHLLFLCLLCAEEEVEAAGGVVVADAPRRARFRRELAALAEGASELRAECGVDLGALCRERGCARLFAALDARLRRERERAAALKGWGAVLLARLDPTDLDEKAADLEPRVEAYARGGGGERRRRRRAHSSAARSYRAQSSEGPPLAPPPACRSRRRAGWCEDGFARLARERTETTAAQATLEGLLRWAGVPRAVDALYSSGAPAKSLEARCRILIALCRRLHAALSSDDAPLRALLEAPPTLDEPSSLEPRPSAAGAGGGGGAGVRELRRWQASLLRELEAAGISADADAILRNVGLQAAAVHRAHSAPPSFCGAVARSAFAWRPLLLLLAAAHSWQSGGWLLEQGAAAAAAAGDALAALVVAAAPHSARRSTWRRRAAACRCCGRPRRRRRRCRVLSGRGSSCVGG